MMQGLGGLQSLIARGMRNPTQRAPIPPGMQALIQAQQALKQTAAPVTSAGIPTIAGQTEQAIQQHLQPAAPQMGEPQTQVLGQGIPQAAQMAGIAAQQQQAQQQQALQQAMQMAQQQSQPDQAQPMARGGIARLPADNMARIERYAHGGVLGFDGENRSDVPDPLVTQTSDTALQKIEADKARNTRDLADKYKQSLNVMSAVANSGDQQAIQKYAASTQENFDALRNYVNTSYGNRAEQVLNKVLSATVPVEEKPKYTYEEPAKAGIPSTIQQRQVAPPAAPRVESATASPFRPTVKPVAPAAGIAAGITEPTAAEQFGIAQKIVPENPLRQKILDTGEQILAKQKNRPDIEGQGIAALQQYEQERLRQLEEQKGGDFWRRLGALGRDFYERGSGDRLGRIDDLIAARNSESNKASLVSKEMELKLRDAAHQKEIGNLEAYKKTMEEVASLDEKRTGHMINAAQVGAHLAGQKYTAQMSAASSAATNATQLEIARMHQQTLLMQPSDQKRIDDLTRVYILKSTGGKPPTPDQYLEAMKNAMEDVRGASQAGSRDIKAQTEANKQLDAFKTSIEYVTAKTPAEQQALLRKKQAELERQYPGAIFGTEASSDLIKKADAIVKGGR